ncbi:clavesin-2-like [Melitaea cinxia]|uniref:clavesin-2-like n=1 Tax=Melitaea cinxia TaxID=113334 RepID=UPI001E270060|nr:clavesin-2-like [Melitaea cinxia]
MSGVNAFPVKKEYEKNPDISPEDIRKLREWLKTQPHLPEKYITELDLILLFFCCEKSAEVSKQVLDLHYTLRTHLTTWFLNRVVDKKIIQCMNTVLITPFPTFTADGYKVIYCRLLDGDPKRYMFNDIVRVFGMVFDLYQYAEGTWPGLVVLIDMDLTCIGHVGRIDLSTLRQVIIFHQECMLTKLKEVHFLNAPYFMDRFMSLVRPFAKKSFMDMIKIHERGSKSIYQYVPKSAFPKELGGNYKDNITLRDEMIRHLGDNKQYYEEEGRKRVNESLRPNGKTNVEDLFGIQGSFKKLEID